MQQDAAGGLGVFHPLPSRETKAHIEVQEETSCRESEGVPQIHLFFPQEWGTKGVETEYRDTGPGKILLFSAMGLCPC